MTRSKSFLIAIPAFFLALAGLSGCGGGGGSTVSGTVTYNGQPVAKGYVNFFPADGTGSPVGGEIKDGKYTVKSVAPGKNRVDVTSTAGEKGPESMDDAIKAAKGTKMAATDIAPNDDGNGRTHEIGSGSVELNLTLKTMVSSDGKSR